jgi:predicted acyl esterase
VWIQTALPDVDVFVRMTDVYPGPVEGRSMLMAQGIQRARYRDGTCPELLVPNQPAKIRVDLGSTALVLPEGHKLRVIVSAAAGPSLNTANPPLYDINPQNGDKYIDPQHPECSSRIDHDPLRDRSSIGPRHTRAHWPDSAPGLAPQHYALPTLTRALACRGGRGARAGIGLAPALDAAARVAAWDMVERRYLNLHANPATLLNDPERVAAA